MTTCPVCACPQYPEHCPSCGNVLIDHLTAADRDAEQAELSNAEHGPGPEGEW